MIFCYYMGVVFGEKCVDVMWVLLKIGFLVWFFVLNWIVC